MNLIWDSLATFRLQRLLGRDEITKAAREGLIDWLDEHNYTGTADWLTIMLGCPWCRSIWAAGVVLTLRRARGGRVVRDLLALAAAAALVAQALDTPLLEDD